MKKQLTIFGIFLLLGGCTAPEELVQTPVSSDFAVVSSSETAVSEVETVQPEELSAEDFFADYNSFWQTLEQNYPFLQVAERLGFSPDLLRVKGESRITEETTLAEFAQIMEETVAGFGMTGHMGFIGSAEQYAGFVASAPPDMEGHMGYLSKVLHRDTTAATYRYLFPELAEIGAESQSMSDYATSVDPDNVSTQILEEGKIAYVKVKSFSYEQVDADTEKLRTFLRSVEDYPHIILDIRGNGGGSDNYWRRNLLPYLRREPLTVEFPLLFRDTPEIRAYIDTDGLWAQSVPLAELGELPKLPPEDRAALTHACLFREDYEGGESRFDGRVWLLVDDRVYSSSESFTMLCKATGFATIIGANTGGDGAGIDPMLFALPRTGLLWRNSIFYSINPDGSNNEEIGTTPDIVVAENEDALQRCLAEIAQG